MTAELDEARRLFKFALGLACHQPSRQWQSAVLAERVRLQVRLGDHPGAVNAALSLARHAESALWSERERRLGAVYVRPQLHQLGDRVLQQLGRLLLRVWRAHDVVVRYCGDELVVLLCDATGEQAVALGERLRKAVAKHPWRAVHPHLRLSLSIGVAEHRPGAPYGDLLPAADAAVYESKRHGRDRVSIAG